MPYRGRPALWLQSKWMYGPCSVTHYMIFSALFLVNTHPIIFVSPKTPFHNVKHNITVINV